MQSNLNPNLKHSYNLPCIMTPIIQIIPTIHYDTY